MLSLLIFIPSLGVGGAERVFVKVANGLAMRGHRVRMVVGSATGSSAKRINDHVELIDLNCSGVLTAFWPLLNILRHDPPNVLISAMTHTNFVAIASARLARRNIFVIVSERTSLALPLARMADRFARLLMPLIYRLSDAIVAPVKSISEMLVQYTKIDQSRFCIIPNPVTIPTSKHRLDAPHLWAHLSEREKHPLVISIGRLVAEKDFNTLLESFFYAAKRTACRLAIIGDGPERKMLESLIAGSRYKSRVLLFGQSEAPENWYANSDLFVLSSKFEGMPNVLLEAMSWNLPVVSTDCMTGPQEILEGGKWGALVPVRDVEKLGQAIVDALIAPTQIKTVERALDFSDDAVIQEWEELIRKRFPNFEPTGQLCNA